MACLPLVIWHMGVMRANQGQWLEQHCFSVLMGSSVRDPPEEDALEHWLMEQVCLLLVIWHQTTSRTDP